MLNRVTKQDSAEYRAKLTSFFHEGMYKVYVFILYCLPPANLSQMHSFDDLIAFQRKFMCHFLCHGGGIHLHPHKLLATEDYCTAQAGFNATVASS